MNNLELYPLEIFDELIERGGIDKCYEKFLADAENLNGSFNNPSKTDFIIHEKDQNGNDTFFNENFDVYLNREFIKAYEIFCKQVSRQISFINSTSEQKNKIGFYLESIERLEVISIKNNYLGQPVILKWLNNVVLYLTEKYPKLVPESILDKIPELSGDIIIDFFEYKYPYTTLPQLYNKLVDVGLFSDEVTLQDFRSWMSSAEPHTEPKIRIECTDQEAAYIFEKIKEHFHSLTDSKIQEFNLFLSKHGRKLKSGNLQRNRSAFNDNLLNHERRNEIDLILNYNVR